MIELNENSINRTDLIGDDNFDLIAGQSLKIETSPNGEEVINAVCPAGKVWHVHVAVVIEETDA